MKKPMIFTNKKGKIILPPCSSKIELSEMGKRFFDIKLMQQGYYKTVTKKNGDRFRVLSLGVDYKEQFVMLCWECPIKLKSHSESVFRSYLKFNGVSQVAFSDTRIDFTVSKITKFDKQVDEIWISNVQIWTPEKRKRVTINKLVSLANRNKSYV